MIILPDFQQKIIESTCEFAKKAFQSIESGHDWWHTWRVWQAAVALAEKENADVFICSMAALLHDVSDPKFEQESNDEPGAKTKLYLDKLYLRVEIKEAILYITENISYAEGLNSSLFKSLEFQVVQDADRLDAIGAIGVARVFNYGGYKNRRIYIPGANPEFYTNSKEYRASESSSIMHFYEKLLSLSAAMNTDTARSIAIERNKFMLDFLDRFFKEWNEFSEPS